MKYFTILELVASDTARVKGIDNTPTPEVEANLRALAEHVLDPLREAHGQPIKVNCGYRSPALNKAVKGVSTSQHLTGEAADLANTPELQKTVLEMVNSGRLVVDQLIIEKPNRDGVGAWLHVSYSQKKNRNQVLIFNGIRYEKFAF